MTKDRRVSVILILLSVAALVGCRHYRGPGEVFLWSHGANLTFSFGLVFILRLASLPGSSRVWALGGYALAAVWLQELLQLAGLYRGTFDPRDFVFDALGVGAAVAVAALLPGPPDGARQPSEPGR